MANYVLIPSLRKDAPSYTLMDLNFSLFRLDISLSDVLLVFDLSIVAFIIPMIKICFIKLVKIIRSKE